MLQSLLQRAREARNGELGDGEGLEEGFTLIELMVVLLIIAILLAIAIPTFLGVTSSASDRAAQSNLTNALTEAKAVFQNGSTYNGITAAIFQSSAPEFSWVAGGTNCASTSTNCISAQVLDLDATSDGLGVLLAAYSPKDTTCWYAVDLEATPAVNITAGAGDSAFGTATTLPSGATTAGVYYAELSAGGSEGVASGGIDGDCYGNYPNTVTSSSKWFPSYALAKASSD